MNGWKEVLRVYDTISHEWRSKGRGFWTKRKKSATSLLTVLALLAGIAVAFKLFDREVPNNVVRDAAVFDFDIFKMEEAFGDEEFVEVDTAPNGPNPNRIFGWNGDTVVQYPGDTRSVEVKLQNTNIPARDASFLVYISRIVVRQCHDPDPDTGVCANITTVPDTDPRWTRFVNFWTLEVERQKVLVVDGQEIQEDDHSGQNLLEPDGNPDDSGMRQYETACDGTLREINQAAPCDLGLIRAAGERDLLGEQLDVRYYNFNMTEIDDGSDQSEFKGWRIIFDFVFQARVPAIEESVALVGER